jgi:hypothetical protein
VKLPKSNPTEWVDAGTVPIKVAVVKEGGHQPMFLRVALCSGSASEGRKIPFEVCHNVNGDCLIVSVGEGPKSRTYTLGTRALIEACLAHYTKAVPK